MSQNMKFKLVNLGFESSVSIYKKKFSDHKITFVPKFSVTKNITFNNYRKIANKLSKQFESLAPLKF